MPIQNLKMKLDKAKSFQKKTAPEVPPGYITVTGYCPPGQKDVADEDKKPTSYVRTITGWDQHEEAFKFEWLDKLNIFTEWLDDYKEGVIGKSKKTFYLGPDEVYEVRLVNAKYEETDKYFCFIENGKMTKLEFVQVLSIFDALDATGLEAADSLDEDPS